MYITKASDFIVSLTVARWDSCPYFAGRYNKSMSLECLAKAAQSEFIIYGVIPFQISEAVIKVNIFAGHAHKALSLECFQIVTNPLTQMLPNISWRLITEHFKCCEHHIRINYFSGVRGFTVFPFVDFVCQPSV